MSRRWAVRIGLVAVVGVVLALPALASAFQASLVVTQANRHVQVRVIAEAGASCTLSVSAKNVSRTFSVPVIGSKGASTVRFVAPSSSKSGLWTFKATCKKGVSTAWVQAKIPLVFYTIGATPTPPSPATAVFPSVSGQLDVFARSAAGSLEEYDEVVTDGTGSGWSRENLGGSLASAPSATFEDDRVDVFAEARGGALIDYYDTGGAWQHSELKGRVGSAPAALSDDGQINVLAEAKGGTLEDHYNPGTGRWQVESLGGSIVSAPVAIAIGKHLDAFGESLSGTLEHYYDDGSGWHYSDLGGSVASTPAVAVDEGNQNVFARSSTGKLEYYYTANGAWHVKALGGSLVSSPAAVLANGVLNVFAEAKGGTLERWFLRNGAWVSRNLGGKLRSAPTVAFDGTNLDVFGKSSGSSLEYYSYPVAGGSWSIENLGGSIG